MRASIRNRNHPHNRNNNVGFRLVELPTLFTGRALVTGMAGREVPSRTRMTREERRGLVLAAWRRRHRANNTGPAPWTGYPFWCRASLP